MGIRAGIRLVVVDGHTLCRLGLARVVGDQADITVAGEAATAEEGRAEVARLGPDVVLVAADLPGDDGVRLAGELRAADPGLGVVVLAYADGDGSMFRAMEAGASAYVAKSAPAAEFLAAIRSAAVAPGSFSAAGMAAALNRRRTGELLLSPREREVLRLLTAGLSVAAIAAYMHLSHSTAKTYTSRLYGKLGAANRAQALMSALRMGLIDQADLTA